MILSHYIHPEESVNTYLVLTASVLSFFFLFLICIWLCLVFLSCGMQGLCSCSIRIFSCGMQALVHWPGMELRPLALGAQSLSHRTHREVPTSILIISPSLRLCVISFIVQHPLWLLNVPVLFPSLPPNTIKSS